jgi:hypothetical protein
MDSAGWRSRQTNALRMCAAVQVPSVRSCILSAPSCILCRRRRPLRRRPYANRWIRMQHNPSGIPEQHIQGRGYAYSGHRVTGCQLWDELCVLCLPRSIKLASHAPEDTFFFSRVVCTSLLAHLKSARRWQAQGRTYGSVLSASSRALLCTGKWMGPSLQHPTSWCVDTDSVIRCMTDSSFGHVAPQVRRESPLVVPILMPCVQRTPYVSSLALCSFTNAAYLNTMMNSQTPSGDQETTGASLFCASLGDIALVSTGVFKVLTCRLGFTTWR